MVSQKKLFIVLSISMVTISLFAAEQPAYQISSNYENVQFDPEKYGSALEQFLDQYEGEGIYLDLVPVDTRKPKILSVLLGNGHRIVSSALEHPSASDLDLNAAADALKHNTSLPAVLFMEMMTSSDRNFIVDVKKHGFWKCQRRYRNALKTVECDVLTNKEQTEMTSSELQKIVLTCAALFAHKRANPCNLQVISFWEHTYLAYATNALRYKTATLSEILQIGKEGAGIPISASLKIKTWNDEKDLMLYFDFAIKDEEQLKKIIQENWNEILNK